MDELYTVNELSEKLKYSRSTIYRWIEEGIIPYQRLRRQIRFTENDVLSIINQKANSKETHRNGYWPMY
jgi:excisionase family DNA binding protein